MSKNIWFCSDTHFWHKNILTFTRSDGSPLRPGFSSVEEMNEYMIDKWNSVCKPEDTMIFCGDFAINPRSYKILSRLNGNIEWVLGNHDHLHKIQNILKENNIVKNIKYHGVKIIDDLICTHVPVAESSIYPRFRANVHGHLHAYRVKKQIGRLGYDDSLVYHERYINVSVECLDDYTPRHFEDIKRELQKNGI